MSDDELGTDVGRIDTELLDRIARRLDGSRRFATVSAQPADAPDSVVAAYDHGYFPSGVEHAYLRIRWFETDDFNVHYSEQYADGETWECRWDRHPNEHNSRAHFHPPPDAATPGEDATYAGDCRDVLAQVLRELDERITAFWD